MNSSRHYIRHQKDVFKELDADFNFAKIHLMSHWVKQIRRYGALQQYSADRHEQAHNTNLKDSWNASNHNPNYLPQVVTIQRRILCFKIRQLNQEALAQRRENSTTACTVLPPGADLAAPLYSQWYAKPDFMEPKTAVMESIVTLWSKASEHYSAIHKMQRAAWQDTALPGRLSSIKVITRHIYQMINCTHWSSVFTLISRFKLRVYKVNAYLRWVDAQ